jgi:hypothetical protein
MVTPFVPAQCTTSDKASIPANTANPATIDPMVMLRQAAHVHCSSTSAGRQPGGT